MLVIWPLTFVAVFLPFLIPMRDPHGDYQRNWPHFALLMPLTQMLILSSVPELVQVVGGFEVALSEQVMVVAIATTAATTPVSSFARH